MTSHTTEEATGIYKRVSSTKPKMDEINRTGRLVTA